MTERFEAALDHTEEYLRSIKVIPSRDHREPGRIQKHKAESRLQAVIMRHFRKQRAAILTRLESFPPIQASKTTLQYNLDDLLQDDDWLPSITRLLLQFVTEGVQIAGEGFSIGIDYTLVNAKAAEWARKYAGKLIKDIDKTTLDVVKQAIGDFIDTPGMTIGDIMDGLPFDESRSEMIATTEVTNAYGESNQIAGGQMAEEFPDIDVVKIWYTNNDDLVCEICAPLNGEEVDIDESFSDGSDGPAAHVNCRCWTQVRTRISD